MVVYSFAIPTGGNVRLETIQSSSILHHDRPSLSPGISPTVVDFNLVTKTWEPLKGRVSPPDFDYHILTGF